MTKAAEVTLALALTQGLPLAPPLDVTLTPLRRPHHLTTPPP